jgi:hypothetical protein
MTESPTVVTANLKGEAIQVCAGFWIASGYAFAGNDSESFRHCALRGTKQKAIQGKDKIPDCFRRRLR